MTMIKEHECVVLTQDLPVEGLQAGDVGTVVHVHHGEEGYEVEFMTFAGETLAVTTVRPAQIRPVARQDIVHVRNAYARPAEAVAEIPAAYRTRERDPNGHKSIKPGS